MAFEKLEAINEDLVHERKCIVLYHFTLNEIRLIGNVARLMGIKDQIVVMPKNASTVIRDLLEDKLCETEEVAMLDKAILFNGIEATKLNGFMEGLKKCRLRRPLMATITKNSIEWTLNALITNLVEEKQALNANKVSIHEEESL